MWIELQTKINEQDVNAFLGNFPGFLDSLEPTGF